MTYVYFRSKFCAANIFLRECILIVWRKAWFTKFTMRCFDRFRTLDAWATAGLLLWLSVSLLATLYELYSSGGDWLHIAGKLANIGFLGLLLSLVLLRPAPVAKAAGIWPRVTGVAAVALPAFTFALPRAAFSPVLAGTSAALVFAGICGAICVAWWLGRNFSVFAQARGLVTSGPYGFVRHPLYLAEAFVVLGALLAYQMPLALLLFGLIIANQFWRMHYEELVLGAAFPNYKAYADRTARILPGIY